MGMKTRLQRLEKLRKQEPGDRRQKGDADIETLNHIATTPCALW